jgi:ADP-ribose pyrophosphatase YjhB (NUDIX family)
LNFCSQCGNSVSKKIPEDDNRERFVCDDCGFIHYQNPNAVVGTLPYCGDKILLCKRGIEPRKGLWTLPAGFLEMGETLQDGALRETREETNSIVKIDKMYFMFDIPQIGQFYALYKASIEENSYSPTSESLEVELFSYDDIPWEELAFPFVPIALEFFYKDLEDGYFPLRIRELVKKS